MSPRTTKPPTGPNSNHNNVTDKKSSTFIANEEKNKDNNNSVANIVHVHTEKKERIKSNKSLLKSTLLSFSSLSECYTDSDGANCHSVKDNDDDLCYAVGSERVKQLEEKDRSRLEIQGQRQQLQQSQQSQHLQEIQQQNSGRGKHLTNETPTTKTASSSCNSCSNNSSNHNNKVSIQNNYQNVVSHGICQQHSDNNSDNNNNEECNMNDGTDRSISQKMELLAKSPRKKNSSKQLDDSITLSSSKAIQKNSGNHSSGSKKNKLPKNYRSDQSRGGRVVADDDKMDTDHDLADSDFDSTATDMFQQRTREQYQKQVNHIATRIVFRLKILLCVVLVLSTALISLLCYRYTNSAERNELAKQWSGVAERIVASFQSIPLQHLPTLYGTLGIVSINEPLTPYQQAKQQHFEQTESESSLSSSPSTSLWPYVTMSMFQLKASTIRCITGSLYVAIIPIVHDYNKHQWELYSTRTGPIWQNEGFKYQELHGLDVFEQSDSNYEKRQYKDHTNRKNRKRLTKERKEKIRRHNSIVTGNRNLQNKSSFDRSNESVYPIFFYNDDGVFFVDTGPGPYFPRWQSSPVLRHETINENLLRPQQKQQQQPNNSSNTPISPSTTSATFIPNLLRSCYESQTAQLSGMEFGPPGTIVDNHGVADDVRTTITTTSLFATLSSIAQRNQVHYGGDPFVRFCIPILEEVTTMVNNTNKKQNSEYATNSGVSKGVVEVKAILTGILDWKHYLVDVLPRTTSGIHVVLHHTCHQDTALANTSTNITSTSYTYELNENHVSLLGFGDKHDRRYDSMRQSSSMYGTYNTSSWSSPPTVVTLDQTACYYHIDVYPNQVFYDHYITSTPIVITFSVTIVFVFATMLFVIYDRLVERRQRAILIEMAQTSAFVSSLFPESIQRRLLLQQQHEQRHKKHDDHASSSSYTYMNHQKNTHDSNNNSFSFHDSNSHNREIPNGGTSHEGCGRPKLIRHPSNISSVLLWGNSGSGRSLASSAGRSRNRLTTTLPKTLTRRRRRTASSPESVDNFGVGGEIADLYPYCTVFFGDIAGFTAWSSSREPENVFTLLQAVYQRFDSIARRFHVFKVETVGDSYVAVTGLPEPQHDHAVRMCRFAKVCRRKFNELIQQLELRLGPGTSDLMMRFGLNSGPVTAGVLRGDKSRFQLFGDTVNTASRMESTGVANKIHLSKTTANLLMESGKGHWIVERSDMVKAKGKGILQTYWIIDGIDDDNCTMTGTEARALESFSTIDSTMVYEAGTPNTDEYDDDEDDNDDDLYNIVGGDKKNIKQKKRKLATEKDTERESMIRQDRLVGWMVDLLLHRIKAIIARRNSVWSHTTSSKTTSSFHSKPSTSKRLVYIPPLGSTCLDEVKEVIPLKRYNNKNEDEVDSGEMSANDYTYRSVFVSPDVISQLRELVHIIALMYRNNPFHNFEHACHVTMSVNKMLKGIGVTEWNASNSTRHLRRGIKSEGTNNYEQSNTADRYIHFINSDPLALFAIVFSALIHDIDHRGVSNAQLIKEEQIMANMYKNKSIAEQNSLDMSWSLLMSDRFTVLRQCIFGESENASDELLRFRQIVVNVVLATDIFDKELNDLRKARWYNAFSEYNRTSTIRRRQSGGGRNGSSDYDDNLNGLKATIVIEHIIQASDVSHTMQHWHVFCKWNRRLFTEMYIAYCEGRFDKDPSTFWYEGEIKFFDNYIIPLAKKLKDCQVFGVSSEELLSYAQSNREEWKELGLGIVQSLMTEVVPSIQEKFA